MAITSGTVGCMCRVSQDRVVLSITDLVNQYL